MKKNLMIFIILALFSFAGAPPKTGSLVIIVMTEESVLLPGASVTISSDVLMEKRTEITGEDGKATFSNLPPGEYNVDVEFYGFNTVRYQKIIVGLSKPTVINTIMRFSAIREEIAVIGAAGSTLYSSSLRNPFPKNFNTEEYATIKENPFLNSLSNPLSTFSIDVDTASYSNVRRFLADGEMPPEDAVRIEEMVNYFDYNYPQPKGEHPFSITTEVGECPWAKNHRIALIGLKGKELEDKERKPSNLVFLIDVSGSMDEYNKLPLAQKAFKLLVENLGPDDTVAIVVYASAEGLALPATPVKNKKTILNAIESLEAGGCTSGAAGIKLAYSIAKENFLKDGNNKVILATDGDFNVGVSSTSELVNMIEEKRKEGIFLTILGFGMGNLKDSRMEEIADKGNGNYFYIDNFLEAKKVLADQFMSTLFTIAKDVKIQVEFNPAKVKAYRLIGYENRLLNKEDFEDDTKDAGELGPGHTVTALYEIVPAGVEIELPNAPDLKYQKTILQKDASSTDEMMTVKLRYKPVESEKSLEIVKTVRDEAVPFDRASENLRFAASVAAFGMLLRNSEYKGNFNYDKVYEEAKSARGEDNNEYRAEFLKLVRTAKELDSRQK